MPKQSKSKADASEPVVASTPAPVSAPVEVAAKKTKSTKSAKTESAPVATTPAPVVVAPVVSEPVAEPATATEECAVETDISARSTEFLAKLNQWCAMGATLKAEFRAIEKLWSRELKTAQKSSSKRKRKTGNRQPSGFVKPTKISEELASFLGKEKNCEMARTDVTREINKYIRSHNLQDKENGRKIIPDAKLASLLKLNKTDVLTYFNLQRYMSPHFTKTVKTETA